MRSDTVATVYRKDFQAREEGYHMAGHAVTVFQ
jgi:hypothetical protein